MAGEARNFEHEALEADLQRLAESVQRHGERPEMKGEREEALVREALKEAAALSEGGRSVASSPAAAETQSDSLPPYMASASDQAKLEVEYLLDQVFHKGLYKALAEARNSSPFVQDAFHDALTEMLVPELKERKLL